jgi:hypothetical protein
MAAMSEPQPSKRKESPTLRLTREQSHKPTATTAEILLVILYPAVAVPAICPGELLSPTLVARPFFVPSGNGVNTPWQPWRW